MLSAEWIVRRGRHQWGQLLFFGLALFFITFAGVGLSGWESASTHTGIATSLDAAALNHRAVQVGVGLTDDPAAQDAAARQLFQTVFGTGTVAVVRTEAAGPFVVNGRVADQLGLRVFPDEAGRIRTLQGKWPVAATGGSLPVALLGDAAARLHVNVGDTFTIAGSGPAIAARVAAVVEPVNPADPILLEATADPIAVVSANSISTVPAAWTVRWTISPTTTAVENHQIGPLITAVGDLGRRVNNDVSINHGTVTQYGDLKDTLTAIASAAAAVHSVTPIATLLLGAAGAVLIVQLGQLLAESRREETTLLRARGTSGFRLTSAAAGETGTLTAIACSAAVGVAAAFGRRIELRPGPTLAWVIGAVVSAAACAALSTTAQMKPARLRTTAKARIAAVAAPIVLLTVATLIALWRFGRLGSAVEPGQVGVVDPVAVLAPALALLTAAAWATLILTALLRFAAGFLSRGRGLTVLPLRIVSRRTATFGLLMVLVALAFGGATIAAFFDRTRSSLSSAVAQLNNGAAVRVELPNVGDAVAGSAGPAVGYRSLAAGAIADVLVTQVTSNDDVSQLTALPGSYVPDLPAVAGGFDPRAVADQISQEPLGAPVPDDVHSIHLRIVASATFNSTADADTGIGLSFVLWVRDSDGRIIPINFGDLPGVDVDGIDRTLTAALPSGSTGRRIVALDTNSDGAVAAKVSVKVRSMSATTSRPQAIRVPAQELWLPQDVEATDDALDLKSDPAGQIGFTGDLPISPQAPLVRLMPAPEETPPVPAVVDAAMAATLALRIGSTFDTQLEASSRYVHCVVRAISPVLPGSPDTPKVMTDLGATLFQLLQTSTVVPATNQVWIQTSTPDETAQQARAIDGAAVATPAGVGADATLLTVAARSLWLAAAAALLLVLGALAVLAASSVSTRAEEAVILTSLGLSRSRQARLRRSEPATAVGLAVVAGVGAGLCCSWLVVPGLAGAAIGQASTIRAALRVSPVGYAYVGAALLAIAALLLVYGWVIRRQAAAGTIRGTR